MDRKASIQPQCLYSISIPLLTLCTVQTLQDFCACSIQLYLHSYYGTLSSTEHYCQYSTAKFLLPPWGVQTVKSISACTVQLYIYTLYGPYRLFKASMPVK